MKIKTTRLALVVFLTFPGLLFAQSTDLTNDGGNVSAEYSDSPANEGISKLIDNSNNSKYLTFHANAWVQYHATKAYIVTEYRITSANDAEARDPYSWTLSGSNDGVNFSQIDSRSGQNFANRFQTNVYTFTNSTAYTYYRLDMNNNSGSILQLAELELFGEIPVVEQEITNDGGLVSAEYNDSPANEGISKLIDNSSSSKYLTFHANAWVQYKANSSYVLTKYTITSANDAEQRDPYNWTLSGSNDGVNFSQIDSRSGQNFTNRFQTNEYQVSNSSSYTYYRLDMNNNSGNILQLAELELFGTGGDPNGGDCEWGNDFLTPTVLFTDYDGVTTGSQVFHQAIPNPVAHMQQKCLEVAQILYRKSADAPKFRELTFELKDEPFVAYKWGDGDAIGIAVSTQHLANIYNQSGGNAQVIEDEIDGILFHEVTHGYNNSPVTGGAYDGSSPYWAYTEGIADGVRIQAGYHQTRQPNTTDSRKWLGGYTITGFFLHYITQEFDKNFLYKFNERAKSLGQSWSFDAALLSIIGQDAQTTWNQYVNYINGGGSLDYDGDYPWELDCPQGFAAATANARIVEEEEEVLSPETKVHIWPNPATTDINLEFGEAATGVVKLYQSAGNVVAEIEMKKERSALLPVSGLKPGIYILAIRTDLEVSSQKIVVE